MQLPGVTSIMVAALMVMEVLQEHTVSYGHRLQLLIIL